MDRTKLKITAHEIKRALRGSLEKQKNGNALRWAIFEELRLGTGFSSTRGMFGSPGEKVTLLRRIKKAGVTEYRGEPIDAALEYWEERAQSHRKNRDARESRIDMFALDCWPSHGFTRRAYEIKVDRMDLRRELEDPDKRAPWLEVVNAFYLVMPRDLGVGMRGEIEELAPECGIMYYSRKPDKPTFELCDCGREGNAREAPEWSHGYGCSYKTAFRSFVHFRPFNVSRAAMKLDGAEPSWGLVASILRSASR